MTWNLPTILVLSLLIFVLALIVRGIARGSLRECSGDCSSCGSSCAHTHLELSPEAAEKLDALRSEGTR